MTKNLPKQLTVITGVISSKPYLPLMTGRQRATSKI